MRIPPHIVRHLRQGGIAAYPTESCYGIGGLPNHPRVVRQIIRLKKRPQHKGLIVIGANIAQLQKHLQTLSPSVRQQLEHIWPAPATYILPAHARVLPQLRGRRRNGLAVRIPDHPLARELCRQTRSALISTSCNRGGQRPCRSVREVRRRFGRQIPIIRGIIGKRKRPSDIIDWQNGTRLR